MALITSAGVGSGLDLESIISATLDAENLPKLQKFQEKEGELTVELSAVGAVKSSLSSLEDVIDKLADIDNFNKRTATVTQPDSGDLISVTASEDATPAQFNVEVMQLAQGSRAVMADGLFSSVDDVVTATGGTLTYSAGGDTFDVDLAAGATCPAGLSWVYGAGARIEISCFAELWRGNRPATAVPPCRFESCTSGTQD